ncbi:MAG: hypothetical protein JXA50_07190 [Deltaproteobacteria bacterium]|nr:hypothetical protein [Deltaproteobacteria bacterium]
MCTCRSNAFNPKSQYGTTFPSPLPTKKTAGSSTRGEEVARAFLPGKEFEKQLVVASIDVIDAQQIKKALSVSLGDIPPLIILKKRSGRKGLTMLDIERSERFFKTWY